jgi:hypothetical protein
VIGHTPGPWVARLSASRDSWLIEYGDRAELAMVYVEGDQTACEADARLIAAAPELLDALKRIVDAHGGGLIEGKIFGQEWDTARAIIAKATGQ